LPVERTTESAVRALLALPSVAKTEHFSLHVASMDPVASELPTENAPDRPETVDNLALAVLLVVPKRHAKRAVTRNLIKRQMREAVRRHAPACRPPATMIRLRSAFSARQYPCAASGALRAAVRNELDHLFSRCARS
jgi:ribonuclease P protein component